MKREKVFKRENGTQYQIMVELHIDSIRESSQWKVQCWCRDKGKRNWLSLPDTLHDYAFRALSMEEREKHRNNNILRFVTAEEIMSVKLELWNLIKPV